MAQAKQPPESQGSIPARMSDSWLEANVPNLNVGQARELIAALRKKGWGDRKGSLTDRVYPLLSAKVRKALETEAAKAKQ